MQHLRTLKIGIEIASGLTACFGASAKKNIGTMATVPAQLQAMTATLRGPGGQTRPRFRVGLRKNDGHTSGLWSEA